MSSQWSYGPEGLRPKPAASRWGLAADWLRWRDLQPLLLRSAGVVGLAGLTIALISSNAFVGGKPSRPGLAPAVVSAASDLPGAPVEDAVIAAPEATGAISRAQPVSLSLSTEAELPAPADPLPIALQPEPTATASAPSSAAPAPIATPSQTVEPAVSFAGATASAPVAPSPLLAEAEAPAGPMQVASLEPGEIRGRTSQAWEEDAVICPRDWVVAIDANGAGDESCQPIGTVIASLEADDIALRSAIVERAERVAALHPRMPEPRPVAMPAGTSAAVAAVPRAALEETAAATVDETAEAAPEAASEAEAPAPVQDKPKPRSVSSRRNDWPAAPPPDCGPGKRARWHFTDRAAGTKEWYCR